MDLVLTLHENEEMKVSFLLLRNVEDNLYSCTFELCVKGLLYSKQ